MIEPLDPDRQDDVDAVAGLHVEYLGDSPIVGLGERFLRRFFYTTLVRDGLIGCTVCRREGRVVAFISYTRYPGSFMRTGIRRHFLSLSVLMLGSLLRRPALAQSVLRALRLMRERSGDDASLAPDVGEVISIVCAEDARAYVPPGGTARATVRLFEAMVEYFRDTPVERVHLLVKPENTASNLFCAAMGCSFEKIVAEGVPVHRYTYRLQPAS